MNYLVGHILASKDGLWGIPETARGHGNRKKKIYIYIYSTYNTLSNVLKLVTRAFQYACVC